MPLHDVSYRRFGGERTPRLSRSAALARSGLELLIRRRRFWLLLALGWAPAVVRGAQIYIAGQIPQAGDWAARWFEVSPELWKNFLTQQIFPLGSLVALYAGAGAIATDFARGALVIYLAKPISRTDYLLGKALPILGALLAITLVPALALLAFQLGLSEDLRLLREAPWLPLSILGYSFLAASHLTLTVLAVSSLTRSARLAAAGFATVLLGSHFAWGALSQMTTGKAPPYFSLVAAARHGADALFGGESAYAGSPLLSLLSVGLVTAGSALLVHRRLGAAEVVA
jgi:ABC-type transport system involved in multi-copper enzyme maturation permease subunit